MPTHPDAFDLVAEALNGGTHGMAQFYERSPPKWPERARELIFDFLVACPDRPSPRELELLVDAVGTVNDRKIPPSNVVELNDVRTRRTRGKAASVAPSTTSQGKVAANGKAAKSSAKPIAAWAIAKPRVAERAAAKAPAKTLTATRKSGVNATKTPLGKPSGPGVGRKPRGGKPRSPAG